MGGMNGGAWGSGNNGTNRCAADLVLFSCDPVDPTIPQTRMLYISALYVLTVFRIMGGGRYPARCEICFA